MCVHSLYYRPQYIYLQTDVCMCVRLLPLMKSGPFCMFIDNAMHCHSACFSLVIERPSVVYWGGLVKGKLRASLF